MYFLFNFLLKQQSFVMFMFLDRCEWINGRRGGKKKERWKVSLFRLRKIELKTCDKKIDVIEIKIKLIG